MKTKNHVKLGFLKGLISIEASGFSSKELQKFMELYRSTILTLCVILGVILAVVTVLKISFGWAWVLAAGKKGLSILGSAWRFLKG